MTTSVSNATEASAPSGFAALNLSEPVLRAIDEVGYTDPTPVQAATYPVAITGRDIIVQARTGTGKTAAFGIPLVDKLVSPDPWVQALVLAPTRELAVQSQRELARLAQFKGLHTVAIYGGAPMGRQIDELKSGAQLVSGTPGRVLDHLRRGTLEPSRLKVLVLDEMDEMLSMGFAKELNAILEMIPEKGRRQTMCFSATVDGEVRRHAERHMHEPEMISLSSDAVSAAQITHQVYMVSGRDRIGDLVRVLEVEDPDSAIVFCNMRSETERVAMGLKQAGFNADWLNGDLPQRDRERIMASTREGKLRYLVATDVAARGIDISHLTHVINFSFPESAAVYVHRTGRTGRAGRTGCAISLVGPEELGRLYYLRLEYKISPIERSLPTHGELKTRQEIDRIGLLESAFTDRPNPNDLSVARRLLTHPESERILAGLLHTFFGTKEDVDDEAAAARRSKPGPNLEPAVRSLRERDPLGNRERSQGDRPRGRDRDRDRQREGRGRDRDRDSVRPPRDREGTSDREREARSRERNATGEGDSARGGSRDAADDRRERSTEGRKRSPERAPRRRDTSDPDATAELSSREAQSEQNQRNQQDRESPHETNRDDEQVARGPSDSQDSSAPATEDARQRSRERASGRERGSRGRGRNRREGQSGREEAAEQGQLIRDDVLPEQDGALQAAASAPASGERSRMRDRRRAPDIQPLDGALLSTEATADAPLASSDSTALGETGAGEDGTSPPSRRRRKRSRDRGRERSSDVAPLSADPSAQGRAQGSAREDNDTGVDAPRRPERAQRARAASRDDTSKPAVDGELLPFESNGGHEGELAPSEPLEGLLYLNLGKRDGLRGPEVARLLRDSCELSTGQIGRIRVRDRYTFVDVPEGRLDGIIETLSGQVVHDKPLAPERAKAAKS